MKVLKNRKIYFILIATVFILINTVAFFHAYKFTHFTDNKSEKTKSPEKLSSFEKVKTLFFGVNNPKPRNTKFPSQKYKTLKLHSNKEIECWLIKNQNSKGTIILFHGYGGDKSSMISKSDEFIKLGFTTMLVDFMGSGNSEGNQTTIGYKEAEEVKTSFDYLSLTGEKNIYLFGTSMGAVAIMKCISDNKIKPKGIIIECPFGSMYTTVCARFKKMNAPTFPMAGMLLFWGGIQNGFWGFSHNPTEYAKNVDCPTLLLYGEKDKSVSLQEIDEIYSNLKVKKELIIYKNTGHENYLKRNKKQWIKNISTFLSRTSDETSKSEITIQESKKNEKQIPKVDENFEAFLAKFNRDFVFQISRVKFPLKVKEIDLDSMAELDKNKSEFKERTILKSDYTKLDFTYPKDALTRELDRYTQKIKTKNNRKIVEIRGVDNGIYSDFYFEKIEGKWFLQTWKEQST